MPLGVVITRIEVGVVDGFSFGISYGGKILLAVEILIGIMAGVNVRARIIDETQFCRQ